MKSRKPTKEVRKRMLSTPREGSPGMSAGTPVLKSKLHPCGQNKKKMETRFTGKWMLWESGWNLRANLTGHPATQIGSVSLIMVPVVIWFPSPILRRDAVNREERSATFRDNISSFFTAIWAGC